MRHVHEQTVPGIEECQTEEIAIDEAEQRTQNDVDDTEMRLTLGDHHLRSQRRVPVGVFDKTLQRGICMVNEVPSQKPGLGRHLHVFMYGAVFELRGPAFHQSELAIGIISASPDPAAEVEIY